MSDTKTRDRLRAAQIQGWRCDAVAKNECVVLGLDYADILRSSPLERIGTRRLELATIRPQWWRAPAVAPRQQSAQS